LARSNFKELGKVWLRNSNSHDGFGLTSELKEPSWHDAGLT